MHSNVETILLISLNSFRIELLICKSHTKYSRTSLFYLCDLTWGNIIVSRNKLFLPHQFSTEHVSPHSPLVIPLSVNFCGNFFLLSCTVIHCKLIPNTFNIEAVLVYGLAKLKPIIQGSDKQSKSKTDIYFLLVGMIFRFRLFNK